MHNIRLQFLLICSFICVFDCSKLSAQVFPNKNYPKGYFRNPLNIPLSLSGNFGELRPNHYHMGLDMKTEKRENLPVYAAADGFISRIKIEPAGFGRAIYIDHPNGFTTLYAHLNDFAPAIENFVKQQQYKQESWNVFLNLPRELFPVRKGDLIAYSGNTGGSQAPHLHFEVRRSSDDVNLNPMLFGFPIQDDTRPSILRLAVYDRTKSVYEQSPKIVTVTRSGTDYTTNPPVIVLSSPKVSFGITAFDTHTGSSNQNGIFEAVLSDGSNALSAFQMDQISYDDTRYLNAHIDYRLKKNGGPYIQHLSPLPGYINSIYKDGASDGVVDISDGNVHALSITVKDAYGNTSALNFNVKFNGNQLLSRPAPGKIFYPLMLDVFETEDCEFYMGELCLYDSVHINHIRSVSGNPVVVSAVHTIGAPYIPLQDSFMVRIRPIRSLSAADKERVVMQRFSGSSEEVIKVDWQNDWAAARFRDFGSFQLVIDETPPEIVPIGFANGSNLAKSSRLSFTIRDNLGEFKNVRAELDGKWLRFTNDKGKYFHYRFDEHCPPGSHQLRITVEDEAGNKTEKVYNFTR